MYLDNDHANDNMNLFFHPRLRLSPNSIWAIPAPGLRILLNYEANIRTEIRIRGQSNRNKMFWIILTLKRADVCEEFTVTNAMFNVTSIDAGINLAYPILLGKKMTAGKGIRMPYRAQSLWKKVLLLLPEMEISRDFSILNQSKR